jgi:hypothetical protein
MQNDIRNDGFLILDLSINFVWYPPLLQNCVCNIDDRKQTTDSIRKISPHDSGTD